MTSQQGKPNMQTLATTTELRAIIRKVLNKYKVHESNTWTNPSAQCRTRNICVAFNNVDTISVEKLTKKINKKLAKNNFTNEVKITTNRYNYVGYIRSVAKFV
jgi:hypothetical protein